MKDYANKIGSEVVKVKGVVNGKGWLEWKKGDSGGLARPGTFCLWKERGQVFPGCKEAKD